MAKLHASVCNLRESEQDFDEPTVNCRQDKAHRISAAQIGDLNDRQIVVLRVAQIIPGEARQQERTRELEARPDDRHRDRQRPARGAVERRTRNKPTGKYTAQ